MKLQSLEWLPCQLLYGSMIHHVHLLKDVEEQDGEVAWSQESLDLRPCQLGVDHVRTRFSSQKNNKKNVGTRCAEEHHDAEHRPFFSLDQLHYSISASVVLCSRFVVRGIYGPLVVHLYIKGISQEPKIINYCQGAGWTGLSISVLGGLLWNNMTWRCRRQRKT